MRGLLVVVLVGALVSGCAPSSIDGLRQAGAPKETVIPGDYRAVYRSLLATSQKCWIMSYTRLDSQLYPDLQKGEITYYAAEFKARYFAQAELLPAAAGTLLRVYRNEDPVDLRNIERWAAGSTDC